MTERLDRIESGLEETRAICDSNARAIQANAEGIAELKNTLTAFLKRVDEGGLQVQLITEISDDQAGELADLREGAEDKDAQIQALRSDAIADRLTFREEMSTARTQAEADRQAFREEMQTLRAQADTDRQAWQQRADADRAEWQRSFDAQMEAMRSQLLEMSRINRRIDGLEQAS